MGSIILKEKIQNYIPKYPFEEIYPQSILQKIYEKEREKLDKQILIKQKSEKVGVELDDIIFVDDEWCKNKQYIGVVQEINLLGASLEIKYILLNNDLSKSRLPIKYAKEEDVKYILKKGMLKDRNIKTKLQLINILKREGFKNPLFKTRKKRN